ncbi:MAG TPA: TolC family protein [Candidatus Polarisedimenticolia bacterium]|nr:TolC family protein [Candidatus Polarisedimenticolia bacterium]
MTRRVTPPRLALLMIVTLLQALAPPGPRAEGTTANPPSESPGSAPGQEAAQGPAYVVSLQDAVKAALENNLDIVVSSYSPLISEGRVIAAESAFDPSVNAVVTALDSRGPSVLTFVPTRKTHDYLLSFVDPLLTGGQYQIDLEAVDTTVPSSNPLIPGNLQEYDTSWRVRVSQPLLRNFGVKTNKTLVVIARNTLGINDSVFRQSVLDSVAAAEKAYWDLNFSLASLKTSEAALKLAQDFLEQNRIKVRVGTLAPIEITQAEAQVADREEAVIISENLVKTAEDNLRGVMNVPKDSPIWSQPISPSDPLAVVEQSPDMDTSVSTALQRRPDLEQARLNLRSREADLAFRKNQKRWDLLLSGDYGKLGIDAFTYSNSLDALQQGSSFDWTVSLALGIPLGNRLANGNYASSEYAFTQAQKNLDAVELAARVEVRNAVRDVQTTLKRVKAAQVNVRLQKEKLSAEQKKFENGMSTSFQVLQFQTDLFQAATRENLAMVDYNKSQVELERVQGTLLDARHIAVPDNASRRTFPYHPKVNVSGAPGGTSEPAKAQETARLDVGAPPREALPNQFVFQGKRPVANSAAGGDWREDWDGSDRSEIP